MRTTYLRTLSLVVLAFAGVPAGAAAQTRSSAVLNAVEVQQLAARSDPGDHARLAAHFSALADEYAAEARRHTALSKSFAGNPNRRLAVESSPHCAQLAELNSQSAAAVRELAAHHERLAAGTPSTAPREGARFERGGGAPPPTDQELSALAAKARTPSDHWALQEYFLTLASRYAAGADEHAAMARAYRANANRRGGDPAVHCDRLVMLWRGAAREANAAAAIQEALAGLS